MERWTGVLKVPLNPNSRSHCKVAASLCLTPHPKTLTVPSTNAIFFNGDRVEGTGNPIIERLSNIQKIADILVSKFGGSINAWIVEASVFNGPFAVYNDFIPSVNKWGEPTSYTPLGFPASTSIVALLSNCLAEAKNVISGKDQQSFPVLWSASVVCPPKTIILGFSKGGTVLNQLLTELGFLDFESTDSPPHMKEHQISEVEKMNQIIPGSKESLLNSISEVQYVDVGLNSAGAYLTDRGVIERISKRILQGAEGIRFVIHGTPRQWCDQNRVLIRTEKDKLVQLLDFEAKKSGGKLEVCERFYFQDRPPNLQMHFEIIDTMDVS